MNISFFHPRTRIFVSKTDTTISVSRLTSSTTRLAAKLNSLISPSTASVSMESIKVRENLVGRDFVANCHDYRRRLPSESVVDVAARRFSTPNAAFATERHQFVGRIRVFLHGSIFRFLAFLTTILDVVAYHVRIVGMVEHFFGRVSATKTVRLRFLSFLSAIFT